MSDEKIQGFLIGGGLVMAIWVVAFLLFCNHHGLL